VKTFKDYLVEFDTPNIYCDMDGVLVDFVKYTSEHLGQRFTDENWTDLPIDMFYRMPPMTDAKVLWNFIGKYDPFILTAVPRKSPERGPVSERAADDKKRWMNKHFRVNDARVFAVLRKHKANFAKDGRDGRPNLLIDDHAKNVDAFKKAGGLGVVHTSARNTIKELRKLGYK
jgi:hypothetical protein|tara:strand:- start:485 stop:1003 length:519 start_codon:yes stop_codon:yes gene_type:complete